MAAYNEAAVIADKIRNSLAIDYPVDKLEVVIASDGSTTRPQKSSVLLSETESDGRVRLLNYEKNRGKTAMLNDAVPQLRGDVVAFSDASSMLAADSIRTLVQCFSDPRSARPAGFIAC